MTTSLDANKVKKVYSGFDKNAYSLPNKNEQEFSNLIQNIHKKKAYTKHKCNGGVENILLISKQNTNTHNQHPLFYSILEFTLGQCIKIKK